MLILNCLKNVLLICRYVVNGEGSKRELRLFAFQCDICSVKNHCHKLFKELIVFLSMQTKDGNLSERYSKNWMFQKIYKFNLKNI